MASSYRVACLLLSVADVAQVWTNDRNGRLTHTSTGQNKGNIKNIENFSRKVARVSL